MKYDKLYQIHMEERYKNSQEKAWKEMGSLACIKMYSKTIAIWSVELMDKQKRLHRQTYIYGNKQKP